MALNLDTSQGEHAVRNRPMMRRAAAILAWGLYAVLAWAVLASIARAQSPDAETAWSSVLLVLGGVVVLAGLVVALGAAWRVVSTPWDRLQADITALRRQVEDLGRQVAALNRLTREPDAGAPSLLGRVEHLEAQVAEHLADKERREQRRDDLTGEVTIALRDVQKYLARLEADGS